MLQRIRWLRIVLAAIVVEVGLLVGLAAALIYEVLTWKVSLPAAYIVANYLKLIGGMGGGLMARTMLRHKA